MKKLITIALLLSSFGLMAQSYESRQGLNGSNIYIGEKSKTIYINGDSFITLHGSMSITGIDTIDLIKQLAKEILRRDKYEKDHFEFDMQEAIKLYNILSRGLPPKKTEKKKKF